MTKPGSQKPRSVTRKGAGSVISKRRGGGGAGKFVYKLTFKLFKDFLRIIQEYLIYNNNILQISSVSGTNI
jgi:hypothetical protein